MASSTEQKIRDAADRNKELLDILSETDYAAPALQQQQRFVADLQNELAATQKRLEQLDQQRQRQAKEHSKVMRRFAYKITGRREKYEERAAQEEKEYFATVQQEHHTEEAVRFLQAQLADAQAVARDLERDAARHGQAQRDLDGLYNAVFDGPSPGFPEEDEQERLAAEALQAYHDARVGVEAESGVVRLLAAARGAMGDAVAATREALRHSVMDMWGGSTFQDMMERNALYRAEGSVAAARTLVERARRMSPAVRPLPPVNIAHGNLMSDVFFDNIFTDMAFHQQIEASYAEVTRCLQALERELEQARARSQALAADLAARTRRLDETRAALQATRKAAFERVLGRPSEPVVQG